MRSVMMASKLPSVARDRPVAAVGGVLHRVAGLAQSLQNEACGFRIILDEKQAHTNDPAAVRVIPSRTAGSCSAR